MSRPICIYSAAPSGSRAHLFPASCGGRRVDKGIECDPCNQKLGFLDRAIARQLRPFNGVLGVRPDHGSDPGVAIAVDRHTGHEFEVGPAAHIAHRGVRVVEQGEVDGERRVSLQGSRRHLVEHRVAELRRQAARDGKRVRSYGTTETRRFPPKSVTMEFAPGGPLGFRSFTRIALTLLAHHDGELARRPVLDDLKQWVANGSEAEMSIAWWLPWPDDTCLAPSLSPRGHRVVLVFDGTRAWARMRLFGALGIAVDFGALASSPQTVIFDIDPQAERDAGDYRKIVMPEFIFGPIAKPTREDMKLVCDQAESGLDALVRWHDTSAIEQHVRMLLASAAMCLEGDPEARFVRLEESLVPQEPMLLSMLDRVVEALRNTEWSAQAEGLCRNSALERGIDPGLDQLVTMLRLELADRMLPLIEAGSFDSTTATDFLAGERGLAAAKAVTSSYVTRQVAAALIGARKADPRTA